MGDWQGEDMGSAPRWAVLCLAGLCLLLFPALAAPPAGTIELRQASTEVPLAAALRYVQDATAEGDLAAASAWLAHGRFAPLPEGRTAMGFRSGALWFHTRVINRNPDDTRWLLVQTFALTDRIDLYARYADGRVVHQASGDSLPFHQRSVHYRHPNFSVELPLDEPVDLFVREQSQNSMQVPLTLYSPLAFAEMLRDAQLAIGLYYGILLALFFYNLALWLILRDASYLWYLFHLSAFGLVLFTLNGLGFEFLWPNSPWLAEKSVPLSICLSQIGVQQFTRVFLGLRTRWPLGERVSLALIAYFALLAVASMWLPYRLTSPVTTTSVLLSVAWIVIVSIVLLRRGYAPARLFLVAWSMFLLGSAMFAAIAFGVLPKNFFTEYGVQIGSALEMLLLSVALGQRYAALRSENERIVREAKDQLEHKVEQRTTELRSALVQLEDAHARLRESSQRDALTGLHNRSHFRDRFDALLRQAREHRRPLSLLMIDLDNFKLINDRYGHLIGDECLRWAARTLGHVLRPHQDALLARFGGEEFVVVLPGLNLIAATQVAEDLRQHLREAPFRSSAHEIPVTASIGVHAIETVAFASIDPLLQLADQALYRAKADGRDCVRTSQGELA
jgi:diguanylate cyclase (GGDEF)-like protein